MSRCKSLLFVRSNIINAANFFSKKDQTLYEIFNGFNSRNQFLARVFQAIRIEVNDEISALEEMLLSAVELLNPAGRLVVISYHSLEDRLVKNIMKKGSLSGILQKDFFGNPLKSLKEINRKVIVPSQYEIKENSRARSAKLRIGEKIYD